MIQIKYFLSIILTSGKEQKWICTQRVERDAPDLCGPPILKNRKRRDTHGIINLLSTSSIKNISQRALYFILNKHREKKKKLFVKNLLIHYNHSK